MKKKRIFPLYVVIDMSESMKWLDKNGQPPISSAMEIVPTIIESTKRNAQLSAALKVSVIGFNQKASELFMPKKSILDRNVYQLDEWWKKNKDDLVNSCRGKTYYSVLFKKLNEIIKRDQAALDPKEYIQFRPVVYFLTDGSTEQEYELKKTVSDAHDELVSESSGKKPPIILAIGVGEKVEEEDLVEFAAGRLTKEFKFDKDKNKNMPIYSNGVYKKANKDMAFILRGDNAIYHLRSINKGLVKCVIDSILPAQRTEDHDSNFLEPDTGGFKPIIPMIDDEERV